MDLHAGLYNIKDLEVLESNKSYKEFLDHALDIRPSSRTKNWTEMVKGMAVGFLKDQIKKKAYTKDNFAYIEGLSRWASLKTDGYFLHKRREFALTYLKQCQGPHCTRDIMSFWYSTELKDGETAKKLALTLKQIDPKATLTPFLKVIGNDDYSLYHCKKPWIQAEVFSLLTEPLRMEKEKQLVRLLNQIVGPECWKSLRPVIHQALIKGPGMKQDYAYALLSAKKDLTPEWEDFYYVSYFLGNPTPGKKFNKAWNRLKDIGQNYGRRVNVLKKLKQIDPLPGKLFSIIDSGKKNTLIRFFNKNFPEYVTYYSKTCLSYLSGTVNFANGNPTPDCDNLFETKFVEDRIRTKYSAIKK